SLFYPKHLWFSALALILLTTFAARAELPRSADTDDVKKLLKQATKLRRSGAFDQAETVLRRVLEMDPKRSEATVELAYVLTKQRKILEGYNMAYNVANAERQNSRAFAVLGMSLLTGGRFKDARLILFQAIKLNKREGLAWAAYGLLEFYENHISESLADLQTAAAYEPDEPDYLFALGQVSARAENYKEAAAAYDQFLSLSGDFDPERRARIKGLINFLRFLGDIGGLYINNGSDQTSIPFELVGNRPIIKLRINRKDEPLPFVLDTGSGISVISDETAKRLKIKPITKGGFAKGIGGDGKFEIIYGLVKEMGIGDVKITNVPVYIRKFHQNGNNVAGYIGLSLISKFLTTIDYGSQTFALTKKGADTRAFKENSEISLPLRLTSSGFLSGEVQLEGIASPLNFIVDTGASVSVISSQVALLDGISPFINDEKLSVIGSAGITNDVPTFQLPRVTFGKNSRKDITAVALDLGLINEASGFEQSGILGGNFLKNYCLTFDFKNSKVTFVAVKPENE
ncbi:MAG: aspartyl protease family protein, partial [Acidobacteriota bacterium]